MCYYKEQIARWTKATKNWEWNSGVYVFIVLFHFFFKCEQVLFVYVFTLNPPRLSDPYNFITVMIVTWDRLGVAEVKHREAHPESEPARHAFT